MATRIDGPRRAPAAGGAADSLVIFLHGYGADGHDLIDLAEPLATLLPRTAFASPHAPERCEMSPMGYQWFSLRGIEAGVESSVRAAAADGAAPILSDFIASELARTGVGRDRLVLIGFSQGAMMALHVGLRLVPPVAGIIGFSGMLVEPGRLLHEAHGTPPVLLVHGMADPVVPFALMDKAVQGLAAAGIAATALARPGLGHGIDQEGLGAAAQFLRRTLG